ncbi:MAG: nucleotidyltransferase domain-containing protein [Patescibacteria group bacterium]
MKVLGIIKTMVKQSEIQNVVKRIAERYKPEKIYLFGSFAWGEPNKDSDVDFFIVKETSERKFDRQLKVRRIISGDLPADIVVYNNQEIKERVSLGDFFVKKILNQGKLVYDCATN